MDASVAVLTVKLKTGQPNFRRSERPPPLIALSSGALIALLADAFIKRSSKNHLAAYLFMNVGAFATLVSVFYYLRIIVVMYMAAPKRETAVDRENSALYLILFLCLWGVLELGLFPGNLLVLIRRAAGGF